MKKTLKGLIISAIMGIILLSSLVVFADTTTTTWDNNNKGSNVTLSNNNLTAVIKGSYSGGAVKATNFMTSGKWYWEVTLNSATGNQALMLGIANELFDDSYVRGVTGNYLTYYGLGSSGEIYPSTVPYGEGYNIGDVISVELDIDNKNIKFAKNGVWFSNIDLPVWNKYYPMMTFGSSVDECSTTTTTNFGATPFKFPQPISTVSVENITLNKSVLTLQIGATDTLVPTITPSTATNQVVIWTSSDPTIATVDSTGKVTAVKDGTAIITATTTDGSKTATCVVTVTDSSTTTPVTPTNPQDGTNTIVNIAHAKGDNTNNAGGEVSIIFNGVSDATLSVVKTADVKSVWVGDTFTYTIVVKNTGSKTAKAVVINDSAPNHIQFMPSGITTTQGTVDSSSTSSNIVVNVGDVPPSGTVTITVPATVVQ